MKCMPVAHFEDRYKVQTDGKVLNLANNQYLSPIKLKNNYLKVSLAKGNGTSKQILLHVLVAKHFLPNPYDHPQVNHINGDKHDNRVENLEWCSAQQNIHHAFKTKLRPGYMSASDKEKYLFRVLQGEQVYDIAQEIGRHQNTLHKMLRTTADRLGIRDQWDKQMKENRKNAAIRNLEKINNPNS